MRLVSYVFIIFTCLKLCKLKNFSGFVCIHVSPRSILNVLFNIYIIRLLYMINTRNSSGDEIANVNFLYDAVVHTLQNTIYTCKNSATERRIYVLERRFSKFSEITQCNGRYAVQGHSRSPHKVTDFGTNRKLIYNFILVINTNLPPISHHFQVMAD